ncbi:MAG: hypothetical protein LBJ46_06135, partial [Planctomycetota bacterium]|nr:hypothetical protein [Planctomycetota bacterium]
MVRLSIAIFIYVIFSGNVGVRGGEFQRPLKSDIIIIPYEGGLRAHISSQYFGKEATHFGIVRIANAKHISDVALTADRASLDVVYLYNIFRTFSTFWRFNVFIFLTIGVISLLKIFGTKNESGGYYILITPAIIYIAMNIAHTYISAPSRIVLGEDYYGEHLEVSVFDTSRDDYVIVKRNNPSDFIFMYVLNMYYSINVDDYKTTLISIPDDAGEVNLFIYGLWELEEKSTNNFTRRQFVRFDSDYDCLQSFSKLYKPVTSFSFNSEEINGKLKFTGKNDFLYRQAFKQYLANNGCKSFYGALYIYPVLLWTMISMISATISANIFFSYRKTCYLIGIPGILTPLFVILFVALFFSCDDK